MINKSQLAKEALQKAMEVRMSCNLPLNKPVCPFDIAIKLGIDLRFLSLASLEGMYSNEPRPAIVIGSERPLGRQAFTCAHEIGHHAFGHGTKVDEVHQNDDSYALDNPEEFIAQSFAGFLLMPKMAIDRAFSDRHLSPQAATPKELYAVASFFGVGYTTLIDHLAYSLKLLPVNHAQALKENKLKSIRAEFDPPNDNNHVIIADEHSNGVTIDAEIGDLILAPPDSSLDGLCLLPSVRAFQGRYWEAAERGAGRLEGLKGKWNVFVRVRPKKFHGRAIFRHLPEVENE